MEALVCHSILTLSVLNLSRGIILLLIWNGPLSISGISGCNSTETAQTSSAYRLHWHSLSKIVVKELTMGTWHFYGNSYKRGCSSEQVCRLVKRQSNILSVTGRQTGRLTDRRTGKRADRQTDRQADDGKAIISMCQSAHAMDTENLLSKQCNKIQDSSASFIIIITFMHIIPLIIITVIMIMNIITTIVDISINNNVCVLVSISLCIWC